MSHSSLPHTTAPYNTTSLPSTLKSVNIISIGRDRFLDLLSRADIALQLFLYKCDFVFLNLALYITMSRLY